jgi:hypothetical protein
MAAAEFLGIQPVIKEVTVYSYDTLFRGNRSSMVNASSYRTFDSPNCPVLATVGEHVEIQAHLIGTSDSAKVLTANTKVDAKIVILDVYPGMDAGIIEKLPRPPQIRGVLLRTYGMGTAPTSPEVLRALDALHQSGVVVMNVTQARSGRISHGQDPVSLRLFEQGVVSGIDMTAEAAYAKMVVLLSQEDNFERVSDLLQLERAGEQSQSIFHIHFDADETRQDEHVFRATLNPSRKVEREDLLSSNIERVSYIQLRLLGLEPVRPDQHGGNRMIELKVRLVDPAGRPKANVGQLKTDHLTWFARGRDTINIAYDITDAKDRLLSRDHIPSTLVQLQTNEPIKWKRASIAMFTSVRDGR